MGLLSIFKRKGESAIAAGAANEPVDTVQQARVRARQRLIGATVLVVIGVIGFPLVFETQPRPIPVDIPIELPRKDGAAPLVMPPARTPDGAGSTPSARVLPPKPTAPAAPPVAARPAASNDVITESREDAGRPVLSPAPSPSPLPAPSSTLQQPAVAAPRVAKSASKPPLVAAVDPLPKPAQPPQARPGAPAIDSARAKALLEGKPAAAADGERFIVQVGAFADANSARDARVKVEKLGLKTYTQVANTPAGSRIRVRVGPFASRTEADQALARARGAGLAAVVLTL